MTRPVVPADGSSNWGASLRNAIFNISDRADTALTSGSGAQGPQGPVGPAGPAGPVSLVVGVKGPLGDVGPEGLPPVGSSKIPHQFVHDGRAPYDYNGSDFYKNWTKPTGASMVDILMIGSGGAGGPGGPDPVFGVNSTYFSEPANQFIGGGSGGCGGAVIRIRLPASDLPSTLLCNAGTLTGYPAYLYDANYRTLFVAKPGGPGVFGFGGHYFTAGGYTIPQSDGDWPGGGNGAGGHGLEGETPAPALGPSGGGGGGSVNQLYIDPPGTANDGGASPLPYSRYVGGVETPAHGGIVDGQLPTCETTLRLGRMHAGAGGGAASITTTGQKGADALGWGAGGGGGGASRNPNFGGVGGKGGPALIYIVTYFS